MKEKLKLWSDVASNLAIVGLIAWFGGSLIYSHYNQQNQQAAAQRQQVKAGDVIPAFARYATSEKTLVAVMATTCHFCRASLPMIATLDKNLKSKGSEVAVVLQGTATPAAATQFLAPAQDVRYVSGMSTADFRIRGTPTFVLIDRKGKVKQVWVGEINPTSMAEMEKAI